MSGVSSTLDHARQGVVSLFNYLWYFPARVWKGGVKQVCHQEQSGPQSPAAARRLLGTQTVATFTAKPRFERPISYSPVLMTSRTGLHGQRLLADRFEENAFMSRAQ